jgi:hypothetical protein
LQSREEATHFCRFEKEDGRRAEAALGGFESGEVKMTRDAAILRMIALFRKDRDIDETKVIHHLQALLDKRMPGDGRSFDEKERGFVAVTQFQRRVCR